MKKIFLSILLCSIAIFSQAQLNAEQKGIKKTFFDFLSFYQKNQKKFDAFHLYKGKGKTYDPPYKINWPGVEKYFAFLRNSVPYVGDAYIAAEKKTFLEIDKYFKENPTEELPYGFDYDRWAGGQESVEYAVKYTTNPKNKIEVKISGDKAVLRIGEYNKDSKETYWNVVPFAKEKGKWVMANNISPEDTGN